MKKLLLIFCFPLISFSQNIYIPDDAFEQELINLGVDNLLDDSVSLSAIDTITYLDIAFPQTTLEYIYDITGIQFFFSLEYFDAQAQFLSGTLNLANSPNLEYINCGLNDLDTLLFVESSSIEYMRCDQNNLSFIQVSNCFNLETLICSQNQLQNLDVTNCTALTQLSCVANQLTSLDISNNINLGLFQCGGNSLTSLDLSNNINLQNFSCYQNPITSLDLTYNSLLNIVDVSACNLSNIDLRNGNNTNIPICAIRFFGNPNLTCINVDDTSYSNLNWDNTCFLLTLDPQMYYSNNCSQAFCDSLIFFQSSIDSSTIPNQVTFDVQTLNISNSNDFAYCGFVLLDNNGDTVAYENINTAGNVFGLVSFNTEIRDLEIQQTISFPFNGELHLITGWFAGTPSTFCIYPFSISNSTYVSESNKRYNLKFIIDIIGRNSNLKNQPLFYIYDDGTVKKKMVIE